MLKQCTGRLNLDKAIEILNYNCLNHLVFKDPDFLDAMGLGIQALERIRATRLVRKIGPVVLLPGETED